MSLGMFDYQNRIECCIYIILEYKKVYHSNTNNYDKWLAQVVGDVDLFIFNS